MCGIAGIWHRSGEPVDPLALERMAEALVHRGPDGSGVHIDGPIGLANRRLAIVDLDRAADQPMGVPDAGLWITFNGEIHNYPELRRELSARGTRFRTHSDTEVILHAYATWGDACFERFNGMWALAIWDGPQRRLLLSRDRFGIKPLYYSVCGDRVCFASEAKAILAAFPQEAAPNAIEIRRFLGGGYPDVGEATFFENITNLRPATSAVATDHGLRSTRYWKFEPGDESLRPDAEEQFRTLLSDAVRLRMGGDVPIGTCLSGGLDSSSVVGLIDQRTSGPIHCFSAAHEDPAFDESRYAALMARNRGLVMHWVRPDPQEMLATIRQIVWHHDAPTSMRGRFARYFVMREAGRHVKVVIGGQGGDELLAGYPHDPVFYLLDRLRSGAHGSSWWRGLAREASELAAIGGSTWWFLLTALRRYRQDPRTAGVRPYASALNNVLWNGFCSQGLPDLLHGEDALGMAFSVESRAPFLDHRLVEFCFSLPFDEKISDGWTKSLLRRSMSDVLPAEIRERRAKQGFGSPVADWLRLDRNWSDVQELLLDSRSLDRGLFGARRLERALVAFRRGPSIYATHQVTSLFRWITLALWFRDFVDGAGLPPPGSG